jgi:hypothetical protein
LDRNRCWRTTREICAGISVIQPGRPRIQSRSLLRTTGSVIFRGATDQSAPHRSRRSATHEAAVDPAEDPQCSMSASAIPHKARNRPAFRFTGAVVQRVISGSATTRPELRNGTIMLCMKTLTLLAALVLLPTDYAQSAVGTTGQPDAPARDVTFCQLAKTPAEFAGKTIRIRGIFRYALEENQFEPAECCPEEMPLRFYAIIDGNPMSPNARSERLARKLTARMSATALVVFVGTLDGHVLEVERVERIERPSHPKDRDHQPLWVPQNCSVNHVTGE